MAGDTHITRRQFIKLAAGGAAGLTLGFYVLMKEWPLVGDDDFDPNAYLEVGVDSIVTISIFRTEMGQGIQTAIPMIVAEELGADWSKIRVQQTGADSRYGDQHTGGSLTIRDTYSTLRRAGATARTMLIAAAAQIWAVESDSCYAENGIVVHRPTGNRLSFGELAETAAAMPVPNHSSVQLKEPADFKLIGTRKGQIDNPRFVTGSAIFGSDVHRPGILLYATVARCPVFGGHLIDYDDSDAQAIEGVRQIIPISSGIAVVADSTWAAFQGQRALDITWDEGDWGDLGSEAIEETFAEEIQALRDDSGRYEAVYQVAYQAHATMEPMTCVADVREASCDLWAPTQSRQDAQQVAAKITKLPSNSIRIHVPFVGCGCGRRLENDYVEEAVEISLAVGAPVKVFWSRTDDIRHDFYRPGSYHLMRAELDEHGLPLRIDHDIVGQDVYSTDGSTMAYNIRQSTHMHAQELPIPVGAWRAVGNNNNAFANECFIDELAFVNGKDPYEYRLSLLPETSRMRAVLELVATKAGWDSPLPDDWGRGIACHSTWNETPVAQVAEVSVSPEGVVRVHRVVCAIDCGVAVNPDMIEAQMEGGIVFGLSAVLKSKVTLKNGAVRQSNFHDFKLLRYDEMPVIEVYIIDSSAPPSGVGEMGVPPIAPAVANAIFAATGTRIRQIPIGKFDSRHNPPKHGRSRFRKD